MKGFLKRLPERREILYAVGGIVFVIYSWALRGFFYQLSSFILYHSVIDLLGIFAYMMSLALLEALIVFVFLFVLSILLPPRWLSQGFGGKAFLILLVAGAGAVVLESHLTRLITRVEKLYLGSLVALALAAGLVLLFELVPAFRRVLLAVLERMQIFTYIYVPIGLLSVFVVIFRLLR